MLSTEKPPLLIVGAGPTGLVLATHLARHGIRARIIDQAEGPSPTSRALGIHARTLEIFDQLGVIAPILQRGRILREFHLFKEGRRLRSVPIQGINSPYPFILTLPQSETERILIRRLESLGVTVEWQTRLDSLQQEGAEIQAQLIHAKGSRETLSPHFLVGCDGATSTVRQQLGIPFEGASLPTWFGLADLHVPVGLSSDGPSLFLAREGLLFFIPLPGENSFRLVFPLPEQPEEGEPELSWPKIQELVDRRTNRELDIRDPWWFSRFRTGRRAVPTLIHGSILLAGDAAHIHSPVGAQGMNSGIQDAHNLGWKLALTLRGEASPQLLQTYEEERLPVARRILHTTQLTTRMLTGHHPLIRSLRNTFLPLALGTSPLRSRLLRIASQTEFDYSQSSLIGEDIGPDVSPRGPKPGERAPDFALHALQDEDPTGLHPLLRAPRHTLLWFTLSGELIPQDLHPLIDIDSLSELLDLHIFIRDALPAWETPPGVNIHHDQSGQGHQIYNPEARSLYLIRPDGHIAWRSRPANFSALANFLRRVFSPAALIEARTNTIERLDPSTHHPPPLS